MQSHLLLKTSMRSPPAHISSSRDLRGQGRRHSPQTAPVVHSVFTLRGPSVDTITPQEHYSSLGLDGVLALGEVGRPLLLLRGDAAGILLGESPTNGAGLFGSQVEREVLLLRVELAQRVALVRVDDRQGTGDRLAEVVAVLSALEICNLRIRDGRENYLLKAFGGSRAWFLLLHSGEF